jgi:hypothetical protein
LLELCIWTAARYHRRLRGQPCADTLPRVFSEVRLSSRGWRSALVGLAVALMLIGATAPQAAAAHPGAGLRGARPQVSDSCPAVVASSGPVIPHQTVNSVKLNGLKVTLRAAHPASWILAVLVSPRIARKLGDPGQRGAVPIGSATKRFPKPGRATIRVPLDGAVLPAGLNRLPITLIWTESERFSGNCTIFNAGQIPATVGATSAATSKSG